MGYSTLKRFSAQVFASMKSRFEPDSYSEASPNRRLVDPEADDASEQRFAASLEDEAPAFVVEELSEESPAAPAPEENPSAASLDTTAPLQTDLLVSPGEESWREEVAARLSSYRSRRRTKAPRYPSLRLKFEEPGWSAPTRSEGSLAAAAEPKEVSEPPVPEARTVSADTGKLLEFPRPLYSAPQPLDQLADPVFDRPRILEAPELVQPPPALGGIHIEEEEERVQERRLGFDLPLQAAHMSRRWLASGIDALIVLVAFAAFAAIFLKITGAELPWQQAASVSIGLIAVFWAAYQYGMLVLTGSTPGLRVAKLRLSRFDGREVPRSLRRWRMAAMLLSGFSLGMGYLWAFLDEDKLCWHDRITRTYMAPKSAAECGQDLS